MRESGMEIEIEKARMPAIWFKVRRSLQCKSEPGDVHEPVGSISSKRSGRDVCGCSRSIANLKDVVIHGSKRHTAAHPSMCSPRSIGSSELLNPITHEVVVSDSICELRIRNGGGGESVSGFVGMLKPGSPELGRLHGAGGCKPGIIGSPIRRTSSSLSLRSHGLGAVSPRPRSSFGMDSRGAMFCPKCGEQFLRYEALEEHHLSKHAGNKPTNKHQFHSLHEFSDLVNFTVTELIEGDSSRRIVEIICRTSSSRSEKGIERILKVHNMQKTLTQFEEYRELVKLKASKLSKKHPRCIADGNELLRFHGASLECSLGVKNSSSLCTSEKCHVCRILRYGFSTKKELLTGGIGVFTAATSTRALESIQIYEGNPKKALVVCRVIAGRVHRALENVQEIAGQSGFDSVAGKFGIQGNVEELYLLSPRSLLPCFVVIYKS